MKNIIAISAVAALAGSAFGTLGSGSAVTFADNENAGDSTLALTTFGSGVTAQFRSGGIEGPTTGTRFLNAQNTGSSTFDSWAAIRWDLTDFYAQVAADVASIPGATGFQITDVNLELVQSPFSFSSPTGVDGYYVSDDTLNFDPQSAAGAFPASGGPNIDFGLFAGAESFANSWFYDDSVATDIINIASADIVADLNDDSDNALTFAFEATGSGNAAYGGSSAFGTRLAPGLDISYDIVPAPGSAALVGFAGLAAVRRRR